MKAPSASSPNHRSPTVRREKRRHTTVIPDPLALLNLAVQLDERNEDFLKVPLEKGRLYSDEFEDVVHLLSKPVRDTPTKALAPIVLSGLVLRKYDGPDLVNHVRVLRSQARQRWKRKKRNQRWRFLLIIATVVLLFGAYLYKGMSSLYTNVNQWGFMGLPNFILPCQQLPPEEQHTCFAGDAHVWTAVRDNPLLYHKVMGLFVNTKYGAEDLLMLQVFKILGNDRHLYREDNKKEGDLDRIFASRLERLGKDSSAPFAIHTKVTKGVRKSSNVKPALSTAMPLPNKNSLNMTETIVRWLGDSRLAQLIRPQIGHKRVAILDIQCGLGSLLYALSPQSRNYTCLTTSSASMFLGLLLTRNLGMKRMHKSIQFLQMGLGRYLESFPTDEYDVIVGIDSLSYQMVGDDVPQTIQLLSNRLKPNGRLVLVDDVLGPHSFSMPKKPGAIEESTTTAAPTREVIPHYNWTHIFRRSNMQLVVQRDLGLEFRLPDLEKDDNDKQYREDGTPILERGGTEARNKRMARLEMFMDYFLQPLTFYSPVLQRMLKLFRNVLEQQRNEHHRALAHQNGMIIYVMYVATKQSQQAIQNQRQAQQQQQQCGPNTQAVRRQPQQCIPR